MVPGTRVCCLPPRFRERTSLLWNGGYFVLWSAAMAYEYSISHKNAGYRFVPRLHPISHCI